MMGRGEQERANVLEPVGTEDICYRVVSRRDQ